MSQFDELPEGWVETTLGDVTLPFETAQPQKDPDREFVYIDISSIDNSTQKIFEPERFIGKDAPSRTRRIVKSGDVLFSTVRTYLKNIARVTENLDGVLTSTGIAILRAAPGVDKDYIFHIVTSEDFIREISRTMDGTLYPAVTDGDVNSAMIPLPPVNEQRRIVEKIEALTARSRKARAALDQIPALLDQFRQSVLAAAFRGDLTADWRAQNPNVESAEVLLDRIKKTRLIKASTLKAKEKILEMYQTASIEDSGRLPENWQYFSLEKLCDSFQYGTSAKSLSKGDVPVLRMGNLQKGEIDWSDLAYSSDLQEIEKYKLIPNPTWLPPKWFRANAIRPYGLAFWESGLYDSDLV